MVTGTATPTLCPHGEPVMDPRRTTAAVRLAEHRHPPAARVGRVPAQRVLPDETGVAEQQVDVGAGLQRGRGAPSTARRVRLTTPSAITSLPATTTFVSMFNRFSLRCSPRGRGLQCSPHDRRPRYSPRGRGLDARSVAGGLDARSVAGGLDARLVIGMGQQPLPDLYRAVGTVFGPAVADPGQVVGPGRPDDPQQGIAHDPSVIRWSSRRAASPPVSMLMLSS